MQGLNISHLVIASSDVARMTRFFSAVFNIQAHFKNNEFADFVLPGGTRVAFFNPAGKSAQYFAAEAPRTATAIGITVKNVNEFYEHCLQCAAEFGLQFSGPPKEHPWGEPSFLLIDPDSNRWEVTESPSASGNLVNRP